MLRRLCLFLLMLGLALPAAAVPIHCAPAPVAALASNHHGVHHGERKAPLEQAPQHDCIGCIARYSTEAAPIAAEVPASLQQKPLDQLLLARLTAGPDTPPPRA